MVFITGASSGIGEACARIFAQDPKTKGLILVARRKARLDALKKELEKKHDVEIHVFKLDVSKRREIEAFLKRHKRLLARVTVLVNNAGVAHGMGKLQDGDLDDWDRMIDTNIKGLLFLTRGILPHFLANTEGHIVNMSSVAARIVYPGGNVYCATKHAVQALNQALRLDLVGSPIRVTAIAPGMVETEFSIVRLGDGKKAAAVYAGMTPLTGHDVAEAIYWCVKRPKNVNIEEMVIYPVAQASPTVVARGSVA